MAKDYVADVYEYMNSHYPKWRPGRTLSKRWLVIGGTITPLDAAENGAPAITCDTKEKALEVAEEFKQAGRWGRVIVDMETKTPEFLDSAPIEKNP